MTQPRPAGFNPSEHMVNLKGKDYLGARHRLMWLRSEHPAWTVATSILEMDFKAGYAIVRADILDETGRLIANGTKSETRGDFGDFLEKAETGAIGRACAVAGYGTESAADLDEGTVSDAPVPKSTAGAGMTPASGAAGRSPRPAAPTVPPEPDDLAETFHAPATESHAGATSDETTRARSGGASMTTKEVLTAADNVGISSKVVGDAAQKLWGTRMLNNLDGEQRAVVWAEVQR